MEITINQKVFEAAVPAFASPDSEVYDRIAPFIEKEKNAVSALVGDYLPGNDKPAQWACLSAAVHAIPHLDLILTGSGFGVVRNANTAPASRDRVEALKKTLKESESIVRDSIIFDLLRTDWRTTYEALCTVDSLLWCPTVCRQCGLTTLSGEEVFGTEFIKLRDNIMWAHGQLATLISEDQLSALVDYYRTHAYSLDNPPEALTYRTAVGMAQRFMVTSVLNENNTTKKSDAARRLLDYIQKHENVFTEYRDSSVAAAHKMAYENKQESGAFFFS